MPQFAMNHDHDLFVGIAVPRGQSSFGELPSYEHFFGTRDLRRLMLSASGSTGTVSNL